MTKHFYMMVGLPGSGKSYWVQQNLAGLDGIAILSTDNLIQSWAEASGKTYDMIFKESIDRATDIFFQELAVSFSAGDSVLVDRTNLSLKVRRKILLKVPKDYRKSAIIVDCDPKDRGARLTQRKGKFIPNKVMETMVLTYQEPQLLEGFDDIVHVQSGDATLGHHKKFDNWAEEAGDFGQG